METSIQVLRIFRISCLPTYTLIFLRNKCRELKSSRHKINLCLLVYLFAYRRRFPIPRINEAK